MLLAILNKCAAHFNQYSELIEAHTENLEAHTSEEVQALITEMRVNG